jgi:hypothetical protein
MLRSAPSRGDVVGESFLVIIILVKARQAKIADFKVAIGVDK